MILSARVTYAPTKAAALVAMDHAQVAQVLRADLDVFALPIPPQAVLAKSIRFAFDGTVEFLLESHSTAQGRISAIPRTFMMKTATAVNTNQGREKGGTTVFRLKSSPEIEFLKQNSTIQDIVLEECESSRSDEIHPPRFTQKSTRPRPKAADFFRPPLVDYNRSPSCQPDPEVHDQEISKGSSDNARSALFAPDPYSPADNASTPAIISRLTHEYWDTRRDLANTAARGRLVERKLWDLIGAGEAGDKDTDPMELAEQVHQMELRVEEERIKLRAAEKILEDVLRECEAPVVVPQLLRLVQNWDEAD